MCQLCGNDFSGEFVWGSYLELKSLMCFLGGSGARLILSMHNTSTRVKIAFGKQPQLQSSS